MSPTVAITTSPLAVAAGWASDDGRGSPGSAARPIRRATPSSRRPARLSAGTRLDRREDIFRESGRLSRAPLPRSTDPPDEQGGFTACRPPPPRITGPFPLLFLPPRHSGATLREIRGGLVSKQQS